jgi:hypothetical protein
MKGKILVYVPHAFDQFRHNRDTKNGLNIRDTIYDKLYFLTRVTRHLIYL